MEKQEKSKLLAENCETVITIRDTLKDGMRTLSVETNGIVHFLQSTSLACLNNGTETFLDEFLQRFSVYCDKSEESKRLDNIGYIGNNGANLFYLISKARLQSLNLKQKFFHFLLKKIFFHGETASLEQISRFCMNNHIE